MKNNIIFYVDTTFQLLYSYILLDYLNAEYNSYFISRIKNIDTNALSSKLTTVKYAEAINRSSKKNYISKVIEEKQNCRKILKTICEINPNILVLFKDNDYFSSKLIKWAYKNNTKIIHIQEGLGIYVKREKNISFKIFVKNTLNFFLNYHNDRCSQGLNDKVSVLVASNLKFLKNNQKQNKIILQMPKISPSRHIINRFASEIGIIDDKEKNLKEKVILYYGQPLHEVDIIEKYKETLFLNDLFETLIKLDYKILIKPHPSESLEKYESFKDYVIFEEQYLPGEILPILYDVVYVLTPYSSAAYNVNLWLNIPTIYLYKIIPEISNIINQELLKTSNSYVVDNYDCLFQILNCSELREIQHYDNQSHNLFMNFVNQLLK